MLPINLKSSCTCWTEKLLSDFTVFLGNLPRKEQLSAMVGRRMVNSNMQGLPAKGSTIEEVTRNASPGGMI